MAEELAEARAQANAVKSAPGNVRINLSLADEEEIYERQRAQARLNACGPQPRPDDDWWTYALLARFH
jgi:hypothetical protein